MYCSRCGATMGEGAAFCSACGQPGAGVSAGPPAGLATLPAIPAAEVSSAPAVLYAGFWLRVVAAIIDGLVLAIPLGLVFFLLFASALPSIIASAQDQNPFSLAMTIMPRILLFLIATVAGGWLYWGLMESSAWQATLGKKALGLYVTDLAGNRATFGRTSGRFFAGRGIGSFPYLGGLYFLISCVMAGFTEKKQALHDMIANCLVLRRA